MLEPNHFLLVHCARCFDWPAIHFARTPHRLAAFARAFYSKEGAEAGKESTKTCDEHSEEQGFVFLVVLQHPLEVLLLPLHGHLATQLRLGPQRGCGRLSSWWGGGGIAVLMWGSPDRAQPELTALPLLTFQLLDFLHVDPELLL